MVLVLFPDVAKAMRSAQGSEVICRFFVTDTLITKGHAPNKINTERPVVSEMVCA